MDKASFVYVTYIAATAEAVWNAIVDPKIASLYWSHANVSDWKVGSRWEHHAEHEHGELRLVGKVLENKPFRRLVITWAFPQDENNQQEHSRVAYDLEPVGKTLRLTVTHTDLTPGSDMFKGITSGWPKVLSSMKSYLERGKVTFTAMDLDM